MRSLLGQSTATLAVQRAANMTDAVGLAFRMLSRMCDSPVLLDHPVELATVDHAVCMFALS